jgi:predicted XRE-type DNA-binding protein
MNEKEIVKEVMAMRGWSQATLAKEAGFKQQANITGLLNRGENGMRIDKLAKMLNAMGCEIVIRDKMGSGKEWTVDLNG